MTDLEIRKYLDRNDWRVNSHDFLMDVLNTSRQIIETEYDFETRIMTVITPDNEFTFEWVLGNGGIE